MQNNPNNSQYQSPSQSQQFPQKKQNPSLGYYTIFETRDNVYIKHFATKTIEEYIVKIIRGHPSQTLLLNKWIDNFFRLNKITEEKIKLTMYHYTQSVIVTKIFY